MRDLAGVVVTDCDVSARLALVSTPLGPLLARAETRRVARDVGEVVQDSSDRALLEDVLRLTDASSGARFRGEALTPLTLPGVSLRGTASPAGAPLRHFQGRDLTADPSGFVPGPLLPVLARAHELAAEALVDATELHAQRLHHAVVLLRDVEVTRDSDRRALLHLPELLEAQVRLLLLCETSAPEHAVRELCWRLGPGWEGGAHDLLATARALLAQE